MTTRGVQAKGRIVVVKRFVPDTPAFAANDAQRRYGDLRYKAWMAKEAGARALVVVDWPTPPAAAAPAPGAQAPASGAQAPASGVKTRLQPRPRLRLRPIPASRRCGPRGPRTRASRWSWCAAPGSSRCSPSSSRSASSRAGWWCGSRRW